MMGKGIDVMVIIELLVYKSSELVSYALPLAILMSSIMTIGNLSENYELAALKSAGVSLFRILRPLTVLMIVISVAAFFFANNVWPIANLKFRTLISSVIHKKPLLTLEENVFYTDIEGLSIRAKKKDLKTGDLEDLIIYDYKNTQATKRVIRAEKGSMKQTEDQRFLLMTLENGYMYDEQKEEPPKNPAAKKKYKRPHVKSKFKKDEIRYDMSSLFFVKRDEESFDDRPKMMTINQINMISDSLDRSIDQRIKDIDRYNEKSLLVNKYEFDKLSKAKRLQKQAKKDTVKKEIQIADDAKVKSYFQQQENPINDSLKEVIINGNFLADLNPVQKKRIYKQAHEVANQQSDYHSNIVSFQESIKQRKRNYNIEFHRKFYLGFSCLVLFFIGAPLGAILRKGGIGYPAIFALVLFIMYYILNVIGERMVKAGSLDAWQGMWMSSIVLFPLGIFLTYKAATDSSIMDGEVFTKFFKKVFKRKKKIEAKA